MKEVFILLDIYDNYAISNYGRLKNVKTNKFLIPTLNQNYYNYNLCQNGIKKTIRAHRLVAMYFVQNKENKPCVNHIDGNKLNNISSNLEWCTNKENTEHAQKNGLKHDNKPIKSIHLQTNEVTVFYSIKECATFLNTNRGSIHKVLSGKRKHHKNYFFEYC